MKGRTSILSTFHTPFCFNISVVDKYERYKDFIEQQSAILIIYKIVWGFNIIVVLIMDSAWY